MTHGAPPACTATECSDSERPLLASEHKSPTQSRLITELLSVALCGAVQQCTVG